jgi:hypothetical protein
MAKANKPNAVWLSDNDKNVEILERASQAKAASSAIYVAEAGISILRLIIQLQRSSDGRMNAYTIFFRDFELVK